MNIIERVKTHIRKYLTLPNILRTKTLMKNLDNISSKIKKEYKYYPWLCLRFPVIIPFVLSLFLLFIKSKLPITETLTLSIFDFFSKGLLGFSFSQLVLEYKGDKDVIKLLRRFTETHLTLEKWKKRLKNAETITENEISQLITSITMTQGEYSDEYDVVNIEKEQKYIGLIKDRLEVIDNIEEKSLLADSLIDHIEILENKGLTDIRSITGLTETYFSEIISKEFTPNRKERRRKK